MITLDNFVRGVDNIQSEIERALSIVQTYHDMDMLHILRDGEIEVVRAQLAMASMQLSALVDDCDRIVLNDDVLKGIVDAQR
jgi:hypothetical protein